MAQIFKKCKICGIEYPYCKTVVSDGVFRYQDVACCPEHGSMYLAQILDSRGVGQKSEVSDTYDSDNNESELIVEDVYFDCDDDDSYDDDEFDDDGLDVL